MKHMRLLSYLQRLKQTHIGHKQISKNFDFSGSIIRGISWKQANLRQANFFNVSSGLAIYFAIFKTIILVTLSWASGFLAILSAIWSTGFWKTEYTFHFFLLIIVICSLILLSFILVFRKGFIVLFGFSAIAICIAGTSFAFVPASPLGGFFIYAAFAALSEFLSLWLGAISTVGSLSFSKGILILSTCFAVLGMQAASISISSFGDSIEPDWIDFVIACFFVLTGNIIGRNSTESNSKFLGILWLTVTLISTGGTSFNRANLTEVNFAYATLKHTDFRDANIIRTYWRGVKGLEFSLLNNTYLANHKIRQLVVSCDGQGQTFDGLDLTGVNLHDANLQDASFVGAGLNQSDLSRADLSKATLKQTQLDGADLTGAILTGAYIEDWGITSTTRLDNVKCDYVFMRVPTKDNPNPLRKPDNWRENFADGEFADFIQPFFDTLDLYHSQDVDPRAISIALKSLADAHPGDDLQFVAMERRGKNGLNLRFTTAPKANKSELSHEYFANYAQIKKELPVAVQMRIAEQDAEIRTLKGTIEQFILTGTHQSNIQAGTIQVIQGELVMTENKGINISAGDNANISGLSSGDGIVNLGTISGNVTNSINQLPDSSEADELNIKTLLTQLQQAIEADTDLSDPDKSDLLEQVQSLAEVKQVEETAKREGIARKAMKIFDATLKSLPDTARIVEACSKLLPLILTALGLPI